MMEDFLKRLLEAAKECGADQADAIISESRELGANVYAGEMEQYEDAATRGVGLRVIKDGRIGYAYSESLSEPMELAASAMASASVVTADENAAIFEGPFVKGDAAREILDAEKDAVKTAFAVYDEMKNHGEVLDTYRAMAYILSGRTVFASTAGAMQSEGYSAVMAMAAPVVGDEGYQEVGFDIGIGKRLCDIDIKAIVDKSIQRGMRYKGALPPKSGDMPVIMHGEAMADMIATFAPVFSGERAQQGLSLLKGKENTRIAAECFTLTDTPYNADFDIYSRFDGEGVPIVERNIIDKGILTTLWYDVRAANKGGVKPTGNASRSYSSPVRISYNNLTLQPGDMSLAELAQKAGSGVAIYEVSGLHSGANAISGDFSLICKGFVIEDGKIGRPFSQAVVSGNFYKLLLGIEAVGNDSESNKSNPCIISPSLLISGLTIAGE